MNELKDYFDLAVVTSFVWDCSKNLKKNGTKNTYSWAARYTPKNKKIFPLAELPNHQLKSIEDFF